MGKKIDRNKEDADREKLGFAEVKRVKLGDVCEVVSGSIPKTSVKDYWDGELDWITPAELTNDSYIIKNSVRKITKLGVEKTGLKSFPANTVILSSRAPIGKVAIAGKEMYCNQGFKNLICSEQIEPKFLFWFLKGKNEYLNSLGRGATFKEISKSIVEKIEINLPTIEKQNEIIKKFEVIRKIIKYRKLQLDKLEDFIRARFVEMFGDPVDNPKEWEKKQLQEIVTEDCSISYGIVQTGDEQENGVPVFRPIDIVNRNPVLEELKKTTEEISNKYKRTILKGREMLITVRANIADTCIVGKEFEGCNVGRGIVPIRTRENILILEFLKHLIDSKHLNDDIKSKAKGITLIQLNMEDLRAVELIIPPIEQQIEFIEFATQVDKLKVEVQKSLDELQTLSDSLMQKYFG